MSEHPHQGGSYRREKDGSLTRIDDAVTAPAEPTPAADETRSTRSKRKGTNHG